MTSGDKATAGTSLRGMCAQCVATGAAYAVPTLVGRPVMSTSISAFSALQKGSVTVGFFSPG